MFLDALLDHQRPMATGAWSDATDLLLPMASMAFHGGPMKMRPASVQLRAKAAFSLN